MQAYLREHKTTRRNGLTDKLQIQELNARAWTLCWPRSRSLASTSAFPFSTVMEVCENRTSSTTSLGGSLRTFSETDQCFTWRKAKRNEEMNGSERKDERSLIMSFVVLSEVLKRFHQKGGNSAERKWMDDWITLLIFFFFFFYLIAWAEVKSRANKTDRKKEEVLHRKGKKRKEKKNKSLTW